MFYLHQKGAFWKSHTFKTLVGLFIQGMTQCKPLDRLTEQGNNGDFHAQLQDFQAVDPEEVASRPAKRCAKLGTQKGQEST